MGMASKSSSGSRRRVLFALIVAALVALGVVVAPTVRALTRSTDRFRPLDADPRVLVEPGAEGVAAAVAAALPAAVATVEEGLFRRFAAPPILLVCASLATFASYGGAPSSAGYVLNGRLFLSPKLAATPERIPQVVAHELTHLHLEQRWSGWRWSRLPFWFSEGLATLVSGGGGAEDVTDDDARRALAAGRAFRPDTSASVWHRGTTPGSAGLPAHLFYREAELFLAHTARDAEGWRRFLARIEEGEALGPAFTAVYGDPLEDAWDRFTAEIRAGAP